MLHWLAQFLDPDSLTHLIAAQGLLVLILVIFAETGLLCGFFLPGDSLLFIGGALCSINLVDKSQAPPLSYWSMCASLVVAAIVGNTVNYLIGRFIGERLIRARPGRIITPARLERARSFYEHHAALSLVLTRFVPVVRTFVPFIAGVSRMSLASYTFWNVLGALVWVFSLTACGYFLGQVSFVQKHIELIVLGVIAVSLLPMAIAAAVRLRQGGMAPVRTAAREP